MDVRIVSRSNSDAVDFGKLKVHCRVRGNHDDSLLRTFLKAAIKQFEEHTCRKVPVTSLELQLPRFPLCGKPIKLPHPPLIEVTSIVYLDTDKADQNATWTFRQGHMFAFLYPSDPDGGWPETYDRGHGNEVQVNYNAGYTPTIDEDLEASLMQLVGHWYEDRLIGEVPKGVRDLWGPFETEPIS